MPRRNIDTSEDKVLDLGTLNPKQKEAIKAIRTHKFTCYGGAKAGGKSHLARVFAIHSCYKYPGIRILFVRATYEDIRQNQIVPILNIIPDTMRNYNGSTHELQIPVGVENGIAISTIQFGNWEGSESENKYQGQEYDIIIVDEATQFTERMFRHLAGCLRGNVGKGFPKKMLLTCNPGGIGHFWVKRLFIDRKFKVDHDHPEKSENPKDYAFIFAKAEDNIAMLQENEGYLEDVSKMSNSDALRYGDWNIMSGQYFDNFDVYKHVKKQFKIPEYWNRYRSFDYGLDMFAVFWWAVDTDGRCWCYRDFEKEDLTPQDAAKCVLQNTLPSEKIMCTYAPPDMWGRQRETGKTSAEIFALNGVDVVKADNNRVQGHMIMRSLLEPIPLHDEYVIKRLGGKGKAPKELPALMFFDNIGQAIEDIQSIQHDETNANDCAKQPHDLTHTIDGIRYFAVSRQIVTETPTEKKIRDPFFDEEEFDENYNPIIGTGEIAYEYMNY